MTVSLHLNGKQIKGHNLKVSVALPLASEDVSGQSSKTTKVQKGDKAKTISVNLQIQFKNAKDLADLVTLAEAKDAKGERVIYPILERTANAMNIRQCHFDQDFNVTEDSSLELWNVSFQLSEHQSVPEKKEARATAVAKKKAVTVQTTAKTKKVNSTTSKQAAATPAATTPTPTAPANPTPAAPKKSTELSTIEKILKGADDVAKKAGF
jgi:hypothetical protein